ncbi:MAG: aspartate kinase [Paludibacteraceae bacterium]|nr:aspartate kinase [Paludibacteraceae bacterium]
MKVFKFGGASVRDAQGIRNLKNIVGREKGDLAVVVSAMGKTTNALERVVNALWLREAEQVEREWAVISDYHEAVCRSLGLASPVEVPPVNTSMESYDELYDQIVSWGELFSTRIVSSFLSANGIDNQWLDMTRLLRTDDTYRRAQVDEETTGRLLKEAMSRDVHVWVLQGFIGGTDSGMHTTLGREGSDYSAAMVANVLDAESVTIWKDVPGILTADPRTNPKAKLIEELDYADAARLAASGAQIIHSKTIQPLEEKNIPLYVRPFLCPWEKGSVVRRTDKRLDMPVEWGK